MRETHPEEVDLTGLAQLMLAFALVLAGAAAGLVVALDLAQRPTFTTAGALGATLIAGGTLAGVVAQRGPARLIDRPPPHSWPPTERRG